MGLCAALVVVVVRALLDIQMIAGGLVKLELGNALQLEQHAGIRHGAFLLWTDAELTYRALHHWVLHLPMLFSPRPEAAAIFLVIVDFLTAGAWFLVIRKRWGLLPSCVAVSLYLATPVGPILSKHVISTAFVPLAAAGLFEGWLRMTEDRKTSGVNLSLWSLSLLIWLNVNHVILVPVWVWACFPFISTPKIPKMAAFFGVLGLIPLLYPANGGSLLGSLSDMVNRPSLLLADPEWFARRMIFVEPYMTDMTKVLYAWPLLLLVAGWVVLKERKDIPPGLLPMLFSLPLFLLVSDVEATVVWQAGLLVMVALASFRSRLIAIASLVYAVLAQLAIAQTFLTFGPPPQSNFFSLSTVAQKEEILDVLEKEFQVSSRELQTLRVFHEEGENGIPAPVPGLRYLADHSRTWSGDGERCIVVSPRAKRVPGGAVDVQRFSARGFHYVAYAGVPGCKTNLIHRLPRALYLDLNRWEFTDKAPWRVGTDLPL